MNTPRRYKLTNTGKTWSMENTRPSEKILLLALRLAEHEKPEGVTRDELKAATGLPKNSFNRAWSYLLENKLISNTARLTSAGRTAAEEALKWDRKSP